VLKASDEMVLPDGPFQSRQVRAGQDENALLAIVLTLAGIVTVDKLVHPAKVSTRITVTPLGIVTDVNDEQP